MKKAGEFVHRPSFLFAGHDGYLTVYSARENILMGVVSVYAAEMEGDNVRRIPVPSELR